MTYDYDIVVSGGGVAGLIAAASFGSRGFSVLCVDPHVPVTSEADEGADLRTTAILQPGQRLLEDVGLWSALAPHAMPLDIMRIIDAGGPEPTPRVTKDFEARDVSDEPFGWNLPNWLLRREFIARLASLESVQFQTGVGAVNFMSRLTEARVKLSNGQNIRCRLVVAADGRHSPMRKAAGIGVQTTRYGQKALAFAVTHPTPHNNVSTEIHQTGGPFTLVPLPDRDGVPASAVVWMDDGVKNEHRMTLQTADFEAEMNDRSCHILGPLKLASRLSIWPIISQKADRLTAQRLALIAEAAHVVPPIGAQGLNMSLRDTATLLDLATSAPETLGSVDMLDAYEAQRMRDIQLRVAGIDMLNRASQISNPLLRDARALGLNTLYSAAPVRKLLMQMGLGTRSVSLRHR